MAGNILSENLTSLENVLQPKPCDRLYTVMGVVVEYRTPIMTRTQGMQWPCLSHSTALTAVCRVHHVLRPGG